MPSNPAARPFAQRLQDTAGFAHYCPCCESPVGGFLPFGRVPRPRAKCPLCGSLERHRLIALYVREKTNLFDGRAKRMLHIAPEPPLVRLFRAASNLDYLSADRNDPKAMVRLDIADIPYPADTFDAIVCSHVLEHVPDDRRAMRELYRVLAPGGWAILQVPINAAVTYEDPAVTDPAQRERLFGQHDHVRVYGPDYAHRLAAAGFTVTIDPLVRRLGAAADRFGLSKREHLHLGRKEPCL